ncbi:hypothetical protein Bpla01_40530 [Burkholderia plantarii]|nr:hypothetical protein Bpla01_40530 [Burkholderia plantarii]
MPAKHVGAPPFTSARLWQERRARVAGAHETIRDCEDPALEAWLAQAGVRAGRHPLPEPDERRAAPGTWRGAFHFGPSRGPDGPRRPDRRAAQRPSAEMKRFVKPSVPAWP